MQINRTLFSRRRISRSLVTVLGLSLVQTVLPPVLAPLITAPKANAITNTYSPAQATEWRVPSNVTQISITIKGGSGGVGGQDCGAGCNSQAGGPRGAVTYSFTVTAGDVIGVYPGRKGVDGISSGNGGGGAAGQDTSLNGTFDGGSGGNAGSSGTSGAGGGGGAASVLLINSVLRAVAGGAGGGGGAANVAGSGRVGSEYSASSLNGTSFTGGTGGTTSACTTTSGGSTNDGGGSGGSGGGYYGGAAMPVYAASVGECAGNGGMRGGNYILTNEGSAVIGNSGVAQGSETVANTDGSIVIDYTPNAITACVETPQTVDIYRVIKLSTTGSCTWTVPAGVTTIDIFAVGGGGAGGSHGGSGGGGGAAISRTALLVTASTNLTVKLGNGGSASFTDGWLGGIGDSTTIAFPSGLFLSANGGSMGVKGVASTAKAGGLGGSAVNGGFAGGAGGVSATTVNSRGAVGKTGTASYFLGTLNQFGGGGGGGTYKDGCTPLDGQLGSSGGAAGASCSSNVNSVGGSALAETGGGGGGGGFGTSGNTLGGKGGSGVIYVRYATNAADSFPAALSSALHQRWMAGDIQILDATREGFIDSTGNFASAREINGTVTIDTATLGTGSTKSFVQLKGDIGAFFNLQNLPTANNYTLFSIAKYQAGSTGRIITASAETWLSGFWNGNTGVAWHSQWLTDAGYGRNDVWALSSDQLNSYRFNGVTRASRNDLAMTIGNTLGINNSRSEQSNWQVGEVLVFNRELNISEVALVETYLSRLYGIALTPNDYSAETDTAASFAGSTFLWAKGSSRLNLSDTFTIEAWVRPTSTCDSTHICYIYSQETALVWGITAGILHYALYGSGTAWVWTSTGVKVKSGEWHHLAISKELVGNRSNSLKFYLDGQLAFTKAGSPYTDSTAAPTVSDSNVVNPSNNRVHIGYRDSGWYFYGGIDEVKLWRGFRTQSEIQAGMHSRNEIDSANLRFYIDFNKSGTTSTAEVLNQATKGDPAFNMLPYLTVAYSDVKSVALSGAYTVVSFPRTYINQNGGWKSPDSITAASVLVAGGGGGGAGQFSSQIAQSGGGGGGGGVFEIGNYPLVGSSYIPVRVGSGGIGGPPSASQPDAHGRRGGTTSFNTSLTAGGGGGGTFSTFNQMNGGSGTAGGGGGGSTGYWNAFDRGIGGTGSSVTIGSATYAGRTGGNGEIWTGSSSGAGGGAGGNATATAPGPGITSLITGTSTEYGRGGTSEAVTTPAYVSVPIAAGNGGDGYRNANQNSGFGVNGANGQVIVRYITALRPAYTKPVNAFLNVGMTETFTINTALDSATAGLTRTFRWESSTAGASGPFTTIKQGTGVSNTFFAWVPTDTSTSGSQYLYRLTVTDSDTAGLFITDSSTAFAVINGALRMTGPVTDIRKTINVARSETFTISSGTPGYRYTLTPVIPGITLDTSTVGTTILRISDTATVGTYLETLTVTDSVSASVSIPLSITISAPPQLTNSAEVIADGQIFTIDPSNSASYNQSANTFSDISGARNPVTVNNGATFSNDFSGVVSLNSSSSQYLSATGFSQLNRWTIETWIRIDSTLATQFCPLTSEYAPTNISFALCVDANRRFYTGFHNGAWTYKRASEVIPLNTWTHLVGTFDGTNINLYINGVSITVNVNDSGTGAGTTPPVPSTNRIFLGKSFETAVGTTANVSYGLARLYNSGFTLANVLTNYNATKDRFTSANLNQLKPSQKYGSLNIETFTVTSGGDTKTVTFAVGNRTGIAWDTSSIPGQVKLTVQESLTPGTYFDTITVTDNFGSSTNLPISFTISKADTITVTAGAATTQVFNGQPATALPVFNISGLVASDTGTVVRRYTGVDWTKTCAQGGGCEVGDTGPGGGTIFFISPTVINVAAGVSTGGRYLEVAPLNWSGLSVESTTAWAKASTSVAGTLSAIGSGAENTRLINAVLTTNSVAAKVAADLTFGGRSDWFLPSTLEVKEMYDALYLPSLAGNLSITNYWSSTQGSNTAQADTFWFGDGGLISPTAKTNLYAMRPIRAYSPDTITVTTVPTGADSYTVTAETPTMTIGSLANYQAVIYQSSGLQINKAQQDPLRVDAYGATLGLPYTITILGGSGSGAVIESLTAGSTATGCAISGDVITSTSAGGCNLQIRKAASRNYLADSTTAVVYFLLWVINQPSPPAGSGPNIALSGQSVVTVDLDLAPMISSLSTYAATAGVTSITITGVGFNDADASFEVKFWRGVIGTGFTVNPAKTQITLTVPVGTRSGKVIVVTSKGLATSEFSLEIAP